MNDMKELNCEHVLISQMAAADGEASEFAKEQLAAHVAACANCQHELKQLQILDHVLAGHTLAEQRVDLWPAIEVRTNPSQSPSFLSDASETKKGTDFVKTEPDFAKPTGSILSWRPFALSGLLLVSYKLLEMLPARDFGLAFKLVPLIIVALLFVLIKENPFRINTELVLER